MKSIPTPWAWTMALLIVSSAASQVTRNVPSQYPTIQAAIAAAGTGDTVLVQSGTYSGPINFLGRAIAVVSAHGATATTILATGTSRAVTFATGEGPASILNGFTITSSGGGVMIQNASPTIVYCRFLNCMATTAYTSPSDGAGIYCRAMGGGTASPTVLSCRFENGIAVDNYGTNTVCGSACVFNATGGTSTPTLSGCSIAGGSGVNVFGSGICAMGFTQAGGLMSPTITNCIVSANTGIAVRLANCNTVLVQDTRIVGNAGGPAVDGVAVQATFTGCLIAGNAAGININQAAVIASSQPGAYAIRNCTIAHNASSSIGGIRAQGYAYAAAQVSVTNSIVWGNSVLDGFTTGVATIATNHSNVGLGTWTLGPGTVSVDPRFVEAAAGDFHLSSTSPCVDAGSSSAAGIPAVDFDGSSRVVGATIDIGVDELPAALFPGSSEDLDLYTWVDGSGDPLASVATITANQVLRARLASPRGTFTGWPPLLFGRLHASGSPAGTTAGFPVIQMDVSTAFLLFGALAPPLQTPGLPATGVDLFLAIPPGFAGQSLRVQLFAVSPTAANGLFAASAAHEIRIL